MTHTHRHKHRHTIIHVQFPLLPMLHHSKTHSHTWAATMWENTLLRIRWIWWTHSCWPAGSVDHAQLVTRWILGKYAWQPVGSGKYQKMNSIQTSFSFSFLFFLALSHLCLKINAADVKSYKCDSSMGIRTQGLTTSKRLQDAKN